MSIEGWSHIIPFANSLPFAVSYLLALFLFFFFVIMPTFLITKYVENKLTADMQARVGYSRVKLSGMFQPLFEVVRDVFKCVDVTANQLLYAANQVIFCLFLFAITPFGHDLVFFENKNATMSIYVLLLFYHLFLFLVFSHEKKMNYVYFFRRVLLVLSASVVALVCHFAMVLRAGSDTWNTIVESQSGHALLGNIAINPLSFLVFAIYMISGLLISGSHPFPSDDKEKLSGFGFLRVISDITHFYFEWTWMFFAQSLFLSGWNTMSLVGESPILGFILGALKASVLLVLTKMITKTVSAMNMAQTVRLLFMYLAPIAIVFLLLETVGAFF